MVQGYLAGWFTKDAPETLEGILREEMLLTLQAQKNDAEAEDRALQVNLAFASMFKDPEDMRKKMFDRSRVMAAYAEGDLLTLWRSKNKAGTGEGLIQGLRELWHDLREQGML